MILDFDGSSGRADARSPTRRLAIGEGGDLGLWAQVAASVKPLRPVPAVTEPAKPPGTAAKVVAAAPRSASVAAPSPPPASGRPPRPGTLDGTWDRRLSRGLVAPETSIDLHGHNLASAYDRLDRGLDQAIRRGDRMLLLVTGKPPRPESERPHARGAIRAAVGDWLASSRHADRIAAVRGAHPRHGGAGALYIVLRRPKAAT